MGTHIIVVTTAQRAYHHHGTEPHETVRGRGRASSTARAGC